MNLGKKISKFVLLFFSRLVLLKYQPLIIGITGSLGKTSATRFIASLLKKKVNLVETEYEFATSLTAPLTILRAKKPKKNKWIFWLLPFFAIKTLKLLLFKTNYPKCFILELRSDVRAGQSMKSLIRSIRPKIGIITAIQPVHLTYFKNINHIIKAKRTLIELLPKNGLALLNCDDPLVKKMASFSQAPVLFYGLSPRADIRAENIELNSRGLNFEIHYQDKVIPIKAPFLFNRAHLYPLLIAAATAIRCFGFKTKDVAVWAKKIKPVQGRGNLVPGIKKTILINDAFNATPRSMLLALNGLMAAFKQRRSIAVLGDMLQMEDQAEKGHRQIGRGIAQERPDILVAVGEKALIIAQEAEQLGYPTKNIFRARNYQEAVVLLREIIKQGDVILFKGSHAMRLYRIIEKLKEKKQ